MGSEKNGRPGKVEEDLKDEEKGGAGFANLGGMMVPDEGEADADKEVEEGPDGAKDPVGRGAGRIVEGGIPVGDGPGRDGRAESAEEEHGEGTEDDLGKEGAHGMVKIGELVEGGV